MHQSVFLLLLFVLQIYLRFQKFILSFLHQLFAIWFFFSFSFVKKISLMSAIVHKFGIRKFPIILFGVVMRMFLVLFLSLACDFNDSF